MKKTVTLVVTLVLVLALALPVSALSGSTTSQYDSGSFNDPTGGTYSYSCTLSASTYSATASMTYGKSASKISTTIDVTIVYGSFNQYSKTKTDGDVSYRSASITVDNSVNVDGTTKVGTIKNAFGNYAIGTTQVSSLYLS